MPYPFEPRPHPDDPHRLPRGVYVQLKDTALIAELWNDFGDPDFPDTTAAVVNMQQPRRRGR